MTPSAPAAIVATGLGKRYVKYDDAPLLLNALRPWARTRRSELWAVRGLDLTVPEGQCVGVIGQNGSGKSTLLRMLAGVTAPTEGSIRVNGRVAPLIAVGVGFHPELSGRENVYVNGTILGLGRAEIERRFDDIVEFSEIGGFIDTPVKFYSSGMMVRLGFSVAVLADPEVLLVDEVLAVGDVKFQLKCFRRMASIKEGGTTVFIVSHNLNAIRNMCDRVVVMHRGTVRHDGEVTAGISMYHDLLGETDEPEDDLRFANDRAGTGPAVRTSGFRLYGPDGTETANVANDDEITLELDVEVLEPLGKAFVGVTVTNQSGVNVYSESSNWNGVPLERGTRATVRARLRPNLATGTYLVQLGVFDGDAGKVMPAVRPIAFYVSGRNGVIGIADLHADLAIDVAGHDEAIA